MIPVRSYTYKFEATRVLGRLLAPDDLAWSIQPPRGQTSDYLIHLSCNAHYAAFIPYIAQRVLQKLGIESFILGGPENCCGNPHRNRGDVDLEPKVAVSALRGFNRMRPQTVLSICPDCDDTFNRFKEKSMTFRYANISQIFVDHLEELSRHMRPVHKRVVVHTHDATESRIGDCDRMMKVLQAIPGLEILPAQYAGGVGNHCQTTAPMPADRQARLFEEARSLQADAVVVPYHSCYRQHIKMELQYGVETVHYAGLLANSLGIEFDEKLKRLRLLDDVDAVIAELSAQIEANGFDPADVRRYVQSAILI